MQYSMLDTCLLSTAYFPPIEYFAAIANSHTILLEGEEMYQKQSYRTRCHIPSGNGLLVLTIPVLRDNGVHKNPVKEIKIDYSKPWLIQHKRAMEAAYMSSPFFEYYADDIFPLLDKKEPYLFDLNLRLIEKVMELIGLKNNIQITTQYLNSNAVCAYEMAPEPDGLFSTEHHLLCASPIDLRERIHPKYKGDNLLQLLQIEKPYYQVFTNKQGFIPNLSILDLLCNEGPNSISFLLESKSYR